MAVGTWGRQEKLPILKV